MLRQGIVAQEITRRYYRHYNDLNISSNGYTGPVLTINYPYQHILGRTPSKSELIPFFNVLKLGYSKKKILCTVLFSKESLLRNKVPPKGIYFSFFGLFWQNKENFVPHMFIQVLNRQPTDNELLIWKKRQRLLTKVGAAILFLRVTEYKINFKIFAISSFTFSISYKLRRLYNMTMFTIKDRLRQIRKSDRRK